MIRRAAAILLSTVDFRRLVCSGELSPDVIRSQSEQTVCCSAAYKYMLHACRIPALQKDLYKIYDPARHNHVIVAVKGHFYRFELTDQATGRPYQLYQLEQALQECIHLATTAGLCIGLGWCTSGNRDDWATARTQLLKIGGVEMDKALMVLESGAVLVCLDIDTTPKTRTAMCETLLHGDTSTSLTASGGNRWFDKSIQLIVTADGQAGLVVEHSMFDGTVGARFADHVVGKTYSSLLTSVSDVSNHGFPTVTPVFSEELCKALSRVAIPFVEKAKRDFDSLVTRNSFRAECFQGYGKTLMKQYGYSPDAYMQMAIQLATYRLWGEQAGTYEPTQIRCFLHGRLDTTRGVSTESAAFVQSLGLRPSFDDATARKKKVTLLQNAVDAHVRRTGCTTQGQGVDLHFVALAMFVSDNEMLPDLYFNPVFQRSKRWRVSTSNMSHQSIDAFGFGQAVPDGVALTYSIRSQYCVFNIAALKETGWTDHLSKLLEEALLEMQSLLEWDQLSLTSKL